MEPFEYSKEEGQPGLWKIRSWEDRFPGLAAGFSSRIGGVSTGEFTSLNCGLHVPDRPEAVVENRRLVADAVGLPLNSWTYGEQIHGDSVAVVTSADKGRGTVTREDEIRATDAFITREENLCLAALFADCVPLYFYDPATGACGLAHGGWKGTAGEIARKTVQAMEREFGVRPDNLLAAIGPSIGSCCYEVDSLVIGKIDQALDGTAKQADESPFCIPQKNGKFSLDLQQVNRQIMIKAGILPINIECTGLCTSCLNDRFFSHRKEQGRTGRMIAWIGRMAGTCF